MQSISWLPEQRTLLAGLNLPPLEINLKWFWRYFVLIQNARVFVYIVLLLNRYTDAGISVQCTVHCTTWFAAADIGSVLLQHLYMDIREIPHVSSLTLYSVL